MIALLIMRLTFLHRPESPVTVLKGQREHFFFLSARTAEDTAATVGGASFVVFLGLVLEPELFLFLRHPPQAINLLPL